MGKIQNKVAEKYHHGNSYYQIVTSSISCNKHVPKISENLWCFECTAPKNYMYK